MGGLGCGCGLVAILLALVTAIPFLGWGNWILTLPAAVLAILFSLIGLASDDRKDTAAFGLILGVSTLFWALFRLALGHGIF
jgi:hypothetical protein